MSKTIATDNAGRASSRPEETRPEETRPENTRLAIDRRQFLTYVGAGATTLVGAGAFGGALSQVGCAAPAIGWVRSTGEPMWTAPAYPVPLPSDSAPRVSDRERLDSYEVIDDLTLPRGFRYDVIAQFGDLFGDGDHQIRFGYNNDYTGLVPIAGSEDEHWLLVNHEYVSYRPFVDAWAEVYGDAPPEFRLEADTHDPPLYRRGVLRLGEWTAAEGNRIKLTDPEEMAAVPEAVKAEITRLSERMLDCVGVSVLRVRRLADQRFEVVPDAEDHRRISAMKRHNVPGEAAEHSRFSGPAAALFDRPPSGTLSNCSGGTTPWGTFLTCEENFYTYVEEDITPEGRPIEGQAKYFGARGDRNTRGWYVFDNPVPGTIDGPGHLFGLDGREYGWVTEIEPTTGKLSKHTALGRFRHENVALRCRKGERLAAYMGDDRRGGHIWKFVSDGEVQDLEDPATARLLEKGTLYVARFTKGGDGQRRGEWIALEPETPLRAPEPEHCFSQHVQVPARFVGGAVAVGDTDRDNPDIEVDYWQEIVEDFTGKKFSECTLGDLVRTEGENEEQAREKKRGVILMDAFLMANACGGTPAARPEDLEVHPDDRSVYIAFTDNTDGSDGSPDLRIFPNSRLEKSLQYGSIYRIVEDGDDPAALTFGWGEFIPSGEVAENGGGFACADNLVFDPAGHLWMVTDISTSVQNFPTNREPDDRTNRGGKFFPGVFGNNSMFMIPTRGSRSGQPHLFAIAPMQAEFCGPTFAEDGETLILSVQHPGEDEGTRTSAKPGEEQVHIVHDRDDQAFEQKRSVPIGSNFPHGELDRAPRPAVVCITRRS